MWNKLISIKENPINTLQLNLKNTLMNGQCFNWKLKDNFYIGCVGRNIIKLKEENSQIFYKFLHKESIIEEINFFHNYFQLEVDIENFNKKIKLDKNLHDTMEKYKGIRIIKQDTLECILSFICSSNNNIERIRKMLESFRQEFGDLIYEDKDLGKFYSFPTLEQLKNVEEEKLRKIGFGYRAKYIVKSVEFMRGNENWIQNLENLDNYEEQLEILLKLSGVGRKVADCILLFSLKKHNIVPLDIHMINFFNESIAGQNKFKKIESVNEKTYKEASLNYIKVFGEFAGWLHSVFYMSRIDGDNKNNNKKGKRKSQNIEDEEENNNFVTNGKKKKSS